MEYDNTNRLIKYNGKEVKYDKDGNMVYGPLNGVMTSFTYDCRNRLIQAGTTKYEYDAEDNRIAVIKNAGTANEVRTEYVVDSVEELSRTLMATEIKTGSGEATANDETSPEGTTTYFYYGNGLIAQENPQEGYLTYHFNNVGSTNAVTDENGKIKYSYDYNPYGELTKGTYGQVMFLFNGQYGVVSDDNGLYYMRARYYNISIKRFINQDIVTGKLTESQSLNRYAYVEGNPVSYLDPFGLEKETIAEIHELIGEINKYISVATGALLVTAVVAPATAEVALTLVDVLGKISTVLTAVDIVLYAIEMSQEEIGSAKWCETFWAAISSLAGIVIGEYNPVKSMAKLDETQSKATTEAAVYLWSSIYENIKGVVDSICF